MPCQWHVTQILNGEQRPEIIAHDRLVSWAPLGGSNRVAISDLIWCEIRTVAPSSAFVSYRSARSYNLAQSTHQLRALPSDHHIDSSVFTSVHPVLSSVSDGSASTTTTRSSLPPRRLVPRIQLDPTLVLRRRLTHLILFLLSRLLPVHRHLRRPPSPPTTHRLLLPPHPQRRSRRHLHRPRPLPPTQEIARAPSTTRPRPPPPERLHPLPVRFRGAEEGAEQRRE